jgi:hypothetical protein
VRLTTSAREAFGQAGLPRNRLLAALTAIHEDLPREAEGVREERVPGTPGCFVWRHSFVSGGQNWSLVCHVGDAGWPTLLWVVSVFIVEGGPVG